MDKLSLARTVIKVVALVVGGLGTVLCGMAVVGLLTDNGWIRVSVATIFAVALPALLADRLMPEDATAAEGVTGDVFAFTWMAVTVGTALGAGAVTRPVLAAEGDRLARSDVPLLASALYLLAGVTPAPEGSDAAAAASAATTSTAATASASATIAPTSASTAVAAAPTSSAPTAEPAGSGAAPTADPVAEPPPEDPIAPELPPERPDHEVFALALPSLATITVDGAGGLRGATGVFVADDLVATCHHLFAGATSARVTTPSSAASIERLSLVAEDVPADLAVVRLTVRPDGARPATFPVVVDEPAGAARAVIVGDPLGLAPTLLVAAVAAHRPPSAPTLAVPLGPRHAGSPVLDERGQLIGLVTGRDEPRVVPAARIAEVVAHPLPSPRAIGAAEPATESP